MLFVLKPQRRARGLHRSLALYWPASRSPAQRRCRVCWRENGPYNYDFLGLFTDRWCRCANTAAQSLKPSTDGLAPRRSCMTVALMEDSLWGGRSLDTIDDCTSSIVMLMRPDSVKRRWNVNSCSAAALHHCLRHLHLRHHGCCYYWCAAQNNTATVYTPI